MPYRISDNKLDRQLEHLIQHLPQPEELTGYRSGSSYYRRVNDRTFLEAYRSACSHITGLQDKYQLTPEQRDRVYYKRDGLVEQVKQAFADYQNPPANLADFLEEGNA